MDHPVVASGLHGPLSASGARDLERLGADFLGASHGIPWREFGTAYDGGSIRPVPRRPRRRSHALRSSVSVDLCLV
jgi:hypothetical protein